MTSGNSLSALLTEGLRDHRLPCQFLSQQPDVVGVAQRGAGMGDRHAGHSIALPHSELAALREALGEWVVRRRASETEERSLMYSRS